MKEILDELLELFSKQVDWYDEKKKQELSGEIDGSYIYDMAYEQIETASRGDLEALLKLLSDYKKLK